MEVAVISRTELETLIYQAVRSVKDDLSESSKIQVASPKQWLSNAEAMSYLGLSRATLARYRARQVLSYSKIGSNLYYRLEDIHDMLERNVVRGG